MILTDFSTIKEAVFMVSESMYKLGTARSVIRELFEFGK